MDTMIEQELRDEVQRLTAELSRAKNLLNRAIVDNAQFKVGDELEEKVRDVWTPVLVRTVFARWNDRVAYQVSFRKKNGEWAMRTHETWGHLRSTNPEEGTNA